jgi:hypothetical protein
MDNPNEYVSFTVDVDRKVVDVDGEERPLRFLDADGEEIEDVEEACFIEFDFKDGVAVIDLATEGLEIELPTLH